MHPPSAHCRTSLRLLLVVDEPLRRDAAATPSTCALIRVAVDEFIAREQNVEPMRVLSFRHRSKTADRPVTLYLPRAKLAFYRRYAALHGASVSALVCSALCFRYFGAQPVPTPGAPRAVVTLTAKQSPKRGSATWRDFLLTLEVGQTRELARTALRHPEHDRIVCHNTAGVMREDTLPGLAITTRLTRTSLLVTRLA